MNSIRELLLISALSVIAPGVGLAQPLVKTAVQVDPGSTKQAGQTFGYRLTYTCSNTSGPCLNAEVVDLLPLPVSQVSTVPASPTGDVAAINVTPNFMGSGRTRIQFVMINPMPAGNSGDLVINVRFPNGTTPDGTIATNTADGINLGATPGTFTTPPVDVTAVAAVQTTLSKTLTTAPANLDMPESYQLQISNVSNGNGSLNLTSIGPMVDTLPPGTVFNGATPAADCQPGCVGTTPATVTWTAPCSVPLQPGASCNVNVNVTFPSATFPSGTNVTNSFTVDATPLGQPPQSLGIGSVTHAVTTFVPSPGATLVKDIRPGDPNGPTLNQTFSYEMATSNNGNVPLDNTVLTDTLPVELGTLSVTTGAYASLSDFAPGVGVRVSYEKNTALGVFTLWGSSPNTTTGTTLTAPPPGLGAGEYLTRVRWQFGQAQVGMSATARPIVTGRVVNPDNAGGPVAFGDSIQNCVDLNAVYTAGPTNVNRNSCRNFNLSGPFVQLDPAKDNLSGGGPFNPGQTVSWRLRVRSAPQSSDPVPLESTVAMDLLPVDLSFGSWTFDDQGTGLPAPQAFSQIPNYAGTGRTLLRWSWNPGSGNLGVNQQVWINIQTPIRNGVRFGSLPNTFVLTHGAPGLAQRCSAASQTDALDLDGDGNTAETHCISTSAINVAAIAQIVASKTVKATCDSGAVSASAGTLPGGAMDYHVRIQNAGTVPMQNFVLVDLLPFVGDTGVRDTNPRGSQWTPLLTSPIVAPAGTVLSYSTSGNPCRGEVGGPVTGCDPPNWTTVAPNPITSVRAFKVEFGARNIDPFDFIEFTLRMLTPGNLQSGMVAFNSFAFQTDRADGLGSLAAEPVKIGVSLGTCSGASLGDFVWVDTNESGVQDDGPTGLNGVFVQLFQPGADGLPGNLDDLPISSTLTSDSASSAPGWYEFPGLAPGSYFVHVERPPTYEFTASDQGADTGDSDVNASGNSAVVALAVNEANPTVDAGLTTSHTASLSHFIWFDANNNGVQDEPASQGVNGVTVQLYVDDGDGVQEPGGQDVIVASAVSADDAFGQSGHATFDGLTPGLPYFVRFALPATATGYTTADAGGDDTLDSDARGVDGASPLVTLAPDEVNSTLDAGFLPEVGTLELGDQVWRDTDNDGVYEPENGEAGIDGVRLLLYRDASNGGDPSFGELHASTVTATAGGFAGRFRFSNLSAGNYIVVVDQGNFAGGALAGLVSSTGNDPAPDPDDDVNGDDNGTDSGSLIASHPITLTANGEPTSEDGNANTNLTLDFGFVPDTGQAPRYDYGDAPDVNAGVGTGEYSTTAFDGGAFHRVGVANAPYLGACVDADDGFNQDPGASTDDTTSSTTVVGTCANGDDEDGVTFTGSFTPGSTASFTVTAGGPVACTLSAWVDWNHNGSFGDAGEQLAANLNVPTGPPTVVTGAVPAGAIPGVTYARFRCSSAGNDTPTGASPDGEVEDYRVGVVGQDFGDAPAPYSTAIVTVDPLAPPLLLGTCVDTEAAAQPAAQADGDDNSPGTSRIGQCFDDEDGVTFPLPITACLTGQVSVRAGGAGRLDAWIDFQQDGAFDAVDQIFAGRPVAAGTNLLTFAAPCNTVSGPSYARFIISPDVGPARGAAARGEVEDYTLGLGALDFGDAPDTYQTLVASGGPSHEVVAGFSLGATEDAEVDGQPSPTATGDGADEDGVTLPGGGSMVVCSSVNFGVTMTNTAAMSSALLDAWIDFDRDGAFNDPRDRVATNFALVAGANNVTVNVPCDSSPGGTSARFRLSSAGVAGAGGAAPDGEVEDYALTIVGTDYGDLPDPTYPTLLASNGARHIIVAGFSLGASVDPDSNGQPDAGATGDDVAGVDDEDGVTFGAPTVVCEPNQPLTVTLTNTAGIATPLLDAWMDFDANGSFDPVTEHLFGGASVPLSAGANNLTYDVPCNAVPGVGTFARFRLSSTGGLGTTGAAADGEVEDYSRVLASRDFGDAPASYATTLAQNGPSHVLVFGFSLGSFIDSEPDGQPSNGADADDLNGKADDEDGVSFAGGGAAACSNNNVLSVTLLNNAQVPTAFLDAWVDFDGNGTFEDPAEHLFGGTSQALSIGANALTYDVPCTAQVGASDLRVRLSSTGGLLPTGLAPDGEVEDYAFEIQPIQSSCSRTDQCFTWSLVSADSSSTPGRTSFTWLFKNTCSSPLARMDLRFVPGATGVQPLENTTVTSVFGHQYTADVVGGPHPGIGFVPLDATPISGGQEDLFTMSVDTSSLDPAVVLWNSASTADGQVGRMDIRSELCFQLAPREVVHAAACARPAGTSDWNVEVQWDRAREAHATGYHLFRVPAAGAQPVRVTQQPLTPDQAGHLRWSERLEAGQAAAYLVQPLDSAGEPLGLSVSVEVEVCPERIPAASLVSALLMAVVLLLAASRAMWRKRSST